MDKKQRRHSKPRKGWGKILSADIKKNGSVKRLMPDFFEDEYHEEWTYLSDNSE